MDHDHAVRKTRVRCMQRGWDGMGYDGLVWDTMGWDRDRDHGQGYGYME